MSRHSTGARRASIHSTPKIYRFAAFIALILGLVLSADLRAQTISFTSIPEGYEGSSIALPSSFAGALGVDPDDDRFIYCAVGGFGAMSLARVNLRTGEVITVADGPFGAIGGIAPLSNSEIVVTDNAAAAGGPPDETILTLKDFNRDGDFNDSGEIKQLIAPILSNSPGNWSGSQARIVPKRKWATLKAWSVMIQTADGAGGSELLAIVEPSSRRPKFATGTKPFHSGFDYNGGFDFDGVGRVIMGTLTGSFTGEIWALDDRNKNRRIDSWEKNRLVEGESGISDLVVDGEEDVFFAGFDGNFFAAIRSFRLPAQPMTGTATPADFASTDGGFLSAILINSKRRPFEPGAGPFGASLILSGFTGSFESATNLLVLRPANTGLFGDVKFADESWPSDKQ